MWVRAILLGLLALSAGSTVLTAQENGYCVQNGSGEPLLFAVDSGEHGRILGELLSDGVLCTPKFASAVNGFVSVFLSSDALEGCSRLAENGSRHTLLEYHDFDRCVWQTTP